MWNSLVNALEKTGDALSQAATNAGKAAREEQYRSPIATTNQDSRNSNNNNNNAVANNQDEEEEIVPTSEAAGRYAAEILARIDSARRKSRSSSNTLESPPENQDNDDDTEAQQQHNEFGMLKQQFQAGWQTVMESTTQSLQRATETTATRWQQAQQLTAQQWKQTQEKLRFEQEKLLSQARTTYYQRAIQLPLDVEALRDAQVVYLTDRLLTLSHPAMASTTHGDISAERKLAAVGHLLQKRHDGRFMVWNLSEVEYNIDILQDQVLTYSFPGSPSPPLGLLLKLLMSMESWLKADPRNVAVVHCLTGKGRTSTVLAAFLCWMGEAGFLQSNHDNNDDDESSSKNIMTKALEYIAQCKQTTVEELTIPSQRRYASYFKNMMDGIRPSQPPLLLKRVILSEAPRYAKGPPLHLNKTTSASSKDKDEGTTAPSSSTLDAETLRLGCAPYLQLFKSGQLLFTAPATLSHAKASQNEVAFCQVADGSVTFLLDQVVQGDILIRCRHLSSNISNSRQRLQRISMFRAAFHTGYVPPQGVMRLTKAQLDGACSDDRFPNDFFMDLIFEPAPESAAAAAAATAAHEPEEDGAYGNGKTSEGTSGSSGVDAAAKRPTAHPLETSNTVTATTYDTMLHRDSRFWEVIDARRKELVEKAAAVAAARRPNSSSDAVESAISGEEGSTDPNKATAAYDPMWGPTIGRRRDFSKAKSKGKNTTITAAYSTATEDSKYQKEKAALQTFSIGGELDFLPEPVTPTAVPTVQPATKPRKKDSLMEALMGALDENYEEHDEESDGVEEIVFTEDAAVNVSPTIVELPPKKKEAKQGAGASKAEVEGKVASREEINNQEAKATTSPEEDTKPATPPQGDAVSTSSEIASIEMDDILANANLELDENMEDLLGGGDDGNTDELLDIDDAELEDLENFLSPSGKK